MVLPKVEVALALFDYLGVVPEATLEGRASTERLFFNHGV